MFASHSQIICTIFGVHIYFYGVVLAAAITVGVLFSDYIGTKFFNFAKETIIDMAPYVVITGIIGARLYYCLLNYDFYLRFPTEILAIRHGGISIHGALIGGFIGLLLFAKRKKMPVLKLCDVSAVGLAIAQSIGRWGNFFNSEAFGTPTNLPWKLYIPLSQRPIQYINYEYFHPTFLYESILDLFIFVLLILLFKKCSKTPGIIACLYLILYSFARIFVEHFRVDSVLNIDGYPVAQIVSFLIIIAASIAMIYISLRKSEK